MVVVEVKKKIRIQFPWSDWTVEKSNGLDFNFFAKKIEFSKKISQISKLLIAFFALLTQMMWL